MRGAEVSGITSKPMRPKREARMSVNYHNHQYQLGSKMVMW